MFTLTAKTDRPPASDMINTPAAWQERTPTGVVRLPHSIAGGGAFVASRNWGDRSDCNAHSDVLAPLIETVPAGETFVLAVTEDADDGVTVNAMGFRADSGS